MRDLSILTFITLDGIMQAPGTPEEDTSGNFTHGGWAKPYWEEVMMQVTEEAMAEPYDLLLGKKTYDLFAPHFSESPDNEVSRKLNSARKYVVTSSSEKLDWNNTTPIKGNIVQKIKYLKEQPGPFLQVHGSWKLIQTLLENQLIDEYRLWTFPIILGNGKKLFDYSRSPQNLQLCKTEKTRSGVIMSIYRKAENRE